MSDTPRSTLPWRRMLAIAALVFGLGGFATPFLVATQPDEQSMWLVEAIPGFTEAAATSPAEGLLASAAVALFAAVLLAVIVLALLVAIRPARGRRARVLAVAAVVLLLGCVGAGFLVLMLSGFSEGDVFVISPAVAAAAVSGVLALVAVRMPASA